MAYRSTGTAVTGTGTAAAPGLPSGLAVGDIVVIGLYIESGDATVTWPTGFALKNDTGVTNATTRGRLLTAWKRITVAGDATDEGDGDYDITWATSAVFEAVAVAHSGIVRQGDPFEGSIANANSTGSTTTMTLALTVASYANDLVGFGTNHTAAGDWTSVPSGMTQRYAAASAPKRLIAATADAAAPGALSKVFTSAGGGADQFLRGFLGALIVDRVAGQDRATTAGATGAGAVTLPTHKTGNRLLVFVGIKPDTTADGSMSAGWTLVKTASGGTGTTGPATGPMKIEVWVKDAASDSETNPTYTPGSGINVWMAEAQSFSRSAGKVWLDAIGANVGWVVTGADTDADSVLDLAFSAFPNAPTTGDAIAWYFAVPSLAGTATSGTTQSVAGLSNGGIIPSALAAYSETPTANDMAQVVGAYTGFSGTASGGFTSSRTISGYGTPTGPGVAVALRQADFTADLTVAGSIPKPTMAVSLSGFHASDLSVAGSIPKPTMAVSLSGFNDSDLTAAGTIPQPVMAMNLAVSPVDTDLTVAGTIPKPVLAVSLAGFNDSDLSVAGTIPQPVMAVDLLTRPTLRVAGTIPQPVMDVDLDVALLTDTVAVIGAIPQPVMAVSLLAEVVLGTDTSNSDDGIWLGDGLAEIIWEPDVVAPPAGFFPRLERDSRVAAQTVDVPPANWGLATYTKAQGQIKYASATRLRVLIGDEDWSFPNGVPTEVGTLRFIDPLLYGSGDLTIRAINPQYPPASYGDLATYFETKRVRIQRVIDGDPATIVDADYYKGFVSRVDTSGAELTLTLAGEGAGRLSAYGPVAPTVYRRRQHIAHIIRATMLDARVRCSKPNPDDSPVLIRRGGTDALSLVSEHIAIWGAADEEPLTYIPNEGGVYGPVVKDTETIHFTVYLDGSLVDQSLAQDYMEQPTHAFVRGETARGELIANIKTPGLTQGPPVDFPLASGVLEFGMTDTDTDSDAGITALQQTLAIHDFYDYDEGREGTFDATTRKAVKAFQRFTKLTVTGTVNEQTWNRLYKLDRIGYSVDDAREYPTAQDDRIDRFLRTANGSKYAANPDFDPHVMPVGLWIDGGRMPKSAAQSLAESKISGRVWTGQLTLRSGVIRGDHTPGDPITADDVADRREVMPNHNVKVVWFAGSGADGIKFSVAGKDDGAEETSLLVSTKVAPTMETFAAHERLQEAKSNLGRLWSGGVRQSQVRQDSVTSWDTASGWLARDRDLAGGEWTEVVVPAGQSGIVERIRLELWHSREFAVVLLQETLGLARLNTINPLADTGDNIWSENQSTADWFRERGVLNAWGWHQQPCGYDPGRKDNGGAVTGVFFEKAGLNYTTGSDPVLYMYVYVATSTGLYSGRILRNQRTTDY